MPNINPKTGFVTGKGQKNAGVNKTTGTVSGPTQSNTTGDTGAVSINPNTGFVSRPTNTAAPARPSQPPVETDV